MTDPGTPAPTTETDTGSTARVLRWVISIITLSICGYMQYWLVLYGNAANVLHQNAQFYGFVTILGILAGLGIGDALSTLAANLKK